MKRFLLIILCDLLGILFVSAQKRPLKTKATDGSTIKGEVIDSISLKGLELASVSLFRQADSLPFDGRLTDKEGKFKFDKLPSGTYKLSAHFLGHEQAQIDSIAFTDSRSVYAGRFLLQPSAKLLEQVTVTTENKIIENKVDRLVFRAENDLTSATGNAADVLRKVPMLSVDLDGNLSLNGSSSLLVLIDGKPSSVFATNIAQALKMLPANEIKQVEVMTSPSSKYDAQGAGGMINIITRKHAFDGYRMNANASIGTLRRASEGVSFNLKKKKLTANSGVSYNSNWRQFLKTASMQQSFTQSFDTKENGAQTTAMKVMIASLNLDYEMTQSNSLSFSYRNLTARPQSNTLSVITVNTTSASQQLSRNTFQKVPNSSNDFGLDLRHQFKNKSELVLSSLLTTNSSHPYYRSDFYYPYRSLYTELADNKGINEERTIQLDFSHPYAKGIFEIGTKRIWRNYESDFNLYDFDTVQNVFRNNLERTNIFDYQQAVFAAYVTLSVNTKNNFSWKVGARYEATAISGTSHAVNQTPAFSNHYQNAFPFLALSKKWNKLNQFVRLTINRRLQRPSADVINPFINSSNPFNVSVGNPFLSPETTNSIDLTYSMAPKNKFFNLTLFYRETANIIEPFTKTSHDSINGVPVVVFKNSYGNIGRVSSFGCNLFASANLLPTWSVRLNASLYTYNVSAATTDLTTLRPFRSVYFVSLNSTWQLKKGWSAEAFGLYNSPKQSIMTERSAFSLINIGFKKSIAKRKATIGVNIIEPFRSNKKIVTQLYGNDFSQRVEVERPFREIAVNVTLDLSRSFKSLTKAKKVNNDDIKAIEE